MNWKTHPRAALFALLAVHVLAHVDRNMLLGFSPQITRELALSNAQYGFLTGAVWVLSFGVMAVFLGSLADRMSRTRIIAVGILVWSACTAASGAAQSFEQMVLARFFVASGEAALVPAAVSLLADLFGPERRGGAVGVFFVGIPLGIGLAFVLAGSAGDVYGWRATFFMLGALGVVIGVPAWFLRDRRDAQAGGPAGASFARQVRDVVAALGVRRTVAWTIAGFMLAHLAFVGLAFMQLWLVRERAFDGAEIARQLGILQIVFGVLGSVTGGVVSDRLARSMPGGHAGFMAALVLVCAPLMIAARLAPAESPVLYLGLCASFFLPLALYGPALALIQGLMPAQMRATITGVTMLVINVFAIAVGNLAAGFASDRLAAAGSASPLTAVVLATDILVLAGAACFLLAARGPKIPAGSAPVIHH